MSTFFPHQITASLKHSFADAAFVPDLNLAPWKSPFTLPEEQFSWHCCCCMVQVSKWEQSGEYSVLSLQFGQTLSKEQNLHHPCNPRTNSIHFNITFLVHLVKWSRRGKFHMRITLNCHHLKRNVRRTRKNYVVNFKFLIMDFIFSSKISVFPLLSKHLCKEQPEGRLKAGTPGKCCTLFFLAWALSLQQHLHHQVPHP